MSQMFLITNVANAHYSNYFRPSVCANFSGFQFSIFIDDPNVGDSAHTHEMHPKETIRTKRTTLDFKNKQNVNRGRKKCTRTSVMAHAQALLCVALLGRCAKIKFRVCLRAMRPSWVEYQIIYDAENTHKTGKSECMRSAERQENYFIFWRASPEPFVSVLVWMCDMVTDLLCWGYRISMDSQLLSSAHPRQGHTVCAKQMYRNSITSIAATILDWSREWERMNCTGKMEYIDIKNVSARFTHAQSPCQE